MKKDLTIGNPIKVILLFSIPLFLSVIFQQLYCIADSFIAGKYIGENALSSVGNAYDISLFYLAFAFGCNTGCQVISAKYFGSKDFSKFKTTVTTTFIFSGIFVIILTALGLAFASPILKLVKTPDLLMNDSLIYLNIYTLGLFFLFFYNIAVGVFSSIGDSRTPFIFLFLSSISNVILDIVFVKYCSMGIAGIAWATFICQGVSCILSLIVLFFKLNTIVKEYKAPLWDSNIFKEILVVGIPSTIQQLSISIGNIIIRRRINSFGEDVMAGYAAAIKLNNLFVTSITALGTAMSNYSSQNYGAKKYERIKKGYLGAILLMIGVSILFSLIYLYFAKDLVGAFMNHNETSSAINIGAKFLYIVAPFYLLVGTKIVSDGILRGTIKMNLFMISTFTDLIIRVVLAYILSLSLESTGIWLSWPIGWFMGMLLSLIFVFKRLNELITNTKKQ